MISYRNLPIKLEEGKGILEGYIKNRIDYFIITTNLSINKNKISAKKIFL